MLMERYDIDAESSFAYSDHPTDAPMLGCVGNPVAVNPVHKMRRLARVEGWPIIEGTWQGEAEATQGEGAEGRSEGKAKPWGRGRVGGAAGSGLRGRGDHGRDAQGPRLRD